MRKKSIKRWTPKHKWIESITIDLKTGKTKYKYFTPKTPEEEKRLEDEWELKMKQIFNILFPKGILEAFKKYKKRKTK